MQPPNNNNQQNPNNNNNQNRSSRNVVDERVSVATDFVLQYYAKLANKTELHNREHSKNRRKKLSRDDFEVLTCIGRGAFGEVRLCKYRSDPSGKVYVMKMVKKEVMIQKNHVTHVRTERNLMVDAARDNPWLVKLCWTFQDPIYLYFVMEFCQGGDLMWWLIQKDTFEERVARFYTAELVLAVYSLHQMDYAHRDLKPDNILIGIDGHIKLTDFGFAKRAPDTERAQLDAQQAVTAPPNNNGNVNGQPQPSSRPLTHQQLLQQHAQQHQQGGPTVPAGMDPHTAFRMQRRDNRALFFSTVGSPGYIAPEVLLQRGHDASVDWWAVGVILYEMLYGYPPFYGDAGAHTGHKIARWREYLEFPRDRPDVSPQAIDLIKKLVCDARDRITIEEILRHPFFTGIDWSTLRSMQAPFQVEVSGPLDTRYFDNIPEQQSPGGTAGVTSPQQGGGAGNNNGAGGANAQFTGSNVFFYGFTSRDKEAPGVTMTMTRTAGGYGGSTGGSSIPVAAAAANTRPVAAAQQQPTSQQQQLQQAQPAAGGQQAAAAAGSPAGSPVPQQPQPPRAQPRAGGAVEIPTEWE